MRRSIPRFMRKAVFALLLPMSAQCIAQEGTAVIISGRPSSASLYAMTGTDWRGIAGEINAQYAAAAYVLAYRYLAMFAAEARTAYGSIRSSGWTGPVLAPAQRKEFQSRLSKLVAGIPVIGRRLQVIVSAPPYSEEAEKDLYERLCRVAEIRTRFGSSPAIDLHSFLFLAEFAERDEALFDYVSDTWRQHVGFK